MTMAGLSMAAELAAHIKGFVAVPVIEVCRSAGLFTRMQPGKRFAGDALAAKLRLRPEGLAQALRVLESIGWAEACDAGRWRLTAATASVQALPAQALRLPTTAFRELLQAEAEQTVLLSQCLDLCRRRWDVRDGAFAGLIDGLLLVPLVHGMRHAASSVAQDGLVEVLQRLPSGPARELEAFFAELRWVERGAAGLAATAAGEQGWRATADASLLLRHAPLLARLGQVLAVDAALAQAPSLNDAPKLDDPRIDSMWPEIERCVLEVFDQLPVSVQPKYLACWHLGGQERIERLAAAIRTRTRRGRLLDAHPLDMLAVQTAREGGEHDQSPLAAHGVAIRVLEGDCLNPEALLQTLRRAPQAGAADQGLHLVNLPGRRMLDDGADIDPARVLAGWAAVASPHGCVLIEEHGREQHVVALPHDAATAAFDHYLDILQACEQQQLRSADDWLMAAAGCGLFPVAGAGVSRPATLPLARWSLHRFEPRDYRIRPARAADLPELLALEQLCWGSELAAGKATLRERMRRHPGGQMALDIGGRLGGAMYSQRIRTREDVVSATAATAIRRHAPDGLIVQLLAVNVQPELQNRSLGDQLLEFMLHRCAVMDGVRSVLAVTRCKDYPQHPDVDAASYLRLRNERGSLVDSVLRFHELHGARIEQLVPRYRPKDGINLGNGVLVAYDIRHRARNEVAIAGQAEAGGAERMEPAAIERDVAALIGALLPEPDSFAASRPLIEMGLDSADLLQLTEALSHRYACKLGSAFFFEFNTCAKVVRELAARLGQRRDDKPAAPSRSAAVPGDGHEAVAIVGVALRLPGDIHDLDALWSLLIEGRDAIGTLPQDRWRWPGAVDPASTHQGIDRCGVMRDVGHFDAEFFRLSPREAELMDPQQRILLELAWQCIEDAGYQASQLAGGATGVYVGASGSDYQHLLQQQPEVAAQYGLAKSMAILANRISYFFDFQGPSLQIDTACSSSLVAVNQALQALRDGTCTQALVAGINVMADPATTLAYYKAGMLSKSGLCRTFDAGADGYVRSEGAVAMLLKPLAQARRDGDHVYALLRGGAVNHGGRAGGLTVPHPIRQAELLVQAYANAAVGPQRLSYIEAHGTGTPLGDPVELQGIKEALRHMAGAAGASQVCGVGSVKTNLGHLEAAAGMAGMLKVVLCMRHRMLPPNAHFRSLNPEIDLGGSGLFVVEQAQTWHAGDQAGPLLAGVSSFGSGGTNAHVVLEEAPPALRRPSGPAAALLPLSAATPEQLRQYAANVAAFIRKARPDIAALCHTMQVGRTPMRLRVVFLAPRVETLLAQLDAYAAGQAPTEGVVEAAGMPEPASPLHVGLRKHATGQELSRACLAWVQGADVDWQTLHGAAAPSRIAVPTYPFARERHWVPPAAAATPGGPAAMHPLVQRNTSTLAGLRFSTHLDARGFELQDHVVRGRKVLPAAAHLEMARAALAFAQDTAAGTTRAELRDVVFLRPAAAGDDGLDLHVKLRAGEDGELAYEICGASGHDDADPVVYCRGRALAPPPSAAGFIDVAALEARCERNWDVAERYAAFERSGLSYGPGFRGLTALRSGRDADGELAVARLALPAALPEQPAYLLHPSLVDAAIQAGLAVTFGPDQQATLLPFALERLEVWSAVTQRGAVVVRRSAGPDGPVRKLDLTLVDEAGRVCARLAGLSCRELPGERAGAAAPAAPAPRTLLAAPRWVQTHASGDGTGHAGHVVVLCEVDEAAARAQAGSHWDGADVRCLQADPAAALAERYGAYAQQLLLLAQEVASGAAAGTLLLQLVVQQHGDGEVLRGLEALLKTASQESPRLRVQVLASGPGGLHAVELGFDPEHILADTATNPGVRLARDGGVYLITGGLGGLGMLLARACAGQAKDVTLVLTGRRAVADDDARLLALRQSGARVDYRAVDVSDAAAVQGLMRHLAAHHGVLTGVVHSAGVLRDGFLLHKSIEELQEVLLPKARALQVLDEATRAQPLDYFVAFSSVAAVFGNVGQADYAVANAFMDGYMRQRAARVRQGQATGRTLSVNWPLWADGGMQVDAATLQRMRRSTGMAPLPTAPALLALRTLLAGDGAQWLVLHGEAAQLAHSLLRAPGQASLTSAPALPSAATPLPHAALADGLRDRARHWVSEVLARRLKLPVARISAAAPVERYGIDSIMMTELVDEFEKSLGALPKTLFFEYATVDALAGYFAAHHAGRLAGLLGAGAPAVALAATASAGLAVPMPAPAPVSAPAGAPAAAGIAVIAVSGRYPQAVDLSAFWANLRAGRDCVVDVPPQRWDHASYFDPRKGVPGKSYCKWGGFIDAVDQFDAPLFNIAPRDAAALDPQCRIFLELTWELLERGAYTADSLRTRHQGGVGLYVGSMYQQYRSSYPETDFNPAMQITSFSAIANRVSSYFGFEGPSVALDTMCSSSAMAIHMACQALASGECAVAVAGGVNLSIHPYKYVGLSQWQLLGSHAASRSFSDGDGYLPAEGAGAVLLKPLADAQRDGDAILAVIKGTATRHSGHSSGYMQPNLQAQAGVMAAALAQAGLGADAIGYVEAAANGGAMGDAIEVLALQKVFAQRREEAAARVPIGSVKSNIGHAEAASGISQLTKVLFQLQHRTLVPTILASPPNPHIDFARSPFRLQTELADWEMPRAEGEGASPPPRRALINSFGAGGSYVSMVVEEYVAAAAVVPAPPPDGPQIVVLSALTPPQLLAQAERLLRHVEDHAGLALEDIAGTLQTARQAMRMRLAWVAADRDGLLAGLRAFVAHGGPPAGPDAPALHHADVDALPEAVARLLSGGVADAVLEQLVARCDLDGLALYWTQGGAIPWERLDAHVAARRVALPTYPFARQRHWIPLLAEGGAAVADAAPDAAPAAPPDAAGAGAAVLARLGQVLGLAPDGLASSQTLRELGFNSIHAVTLKHLLDRSFGRDIPVATLADTRQTAAQLASSVEALVGPLARGGAAPQADGAVEAPQLLSRPEECYQPFPLTDVQEAFYVGRALGAPLDGAYIYFELELGSGVALDALSESWERLVARHAMLRAVIDADGRQRILEHVPAYRIRVADWRRMDARGRAESHAALRERMQRQAPDVAAWPRFDIRVSLHDGQRQLLHFGIDELIADGPSAYQLMREWARACREPERRPAPLEATFRDYVFALKAQEDKPGAAADLAYWTERLDGLPAGPALPLHAGPAAAAGRRTRLLHRLSQGQRAALEEKAQSAGVSLTVLLLTLFSELLRAWTANPRFTLVLTYANRLPLHPQIPDIVGPAISTAFFVAEARSGASLDELALAYQQALWQDLDHMRVSGVRVLRELKVRKLVPAGATFPVVFTSMLNSASAPAEETAQDWPISYTLNQTPQVFLDHQVLDQDGALQLSWDVAEGHYAEGLVARMFDAYGRCLDELAAGRRNWDRAPFDGAAAPGAAQDGARGLTVRSRPDAGAAPFPLSDQQHAYAFGRAAQSGDGLSCQYYQEIESPDLDLDRLSRAWAALMERHPMLRVVVGADGTQRLPQTPPSYTIRSADLSALGAPARERALDLTRRQMVERNAPLDGWPFFEIRVSRLSASSCRLHVTLDMLIADGSSIVLVLNELLAAYQYPQRPLGVPALTFHDYQMAVQDFKGSQAQRDSLAYWNAKFAELPGAPRLSAAVAGAPHGGPLAHARVEGLLSGWPALRGRAQALGVTPSVVLLAAYLETLSAWSDRAPLTVVVPNWDRLPVHADVNQVVGDFTALAWVVHDGVPRPFRERVLDVAAQLRADLAQRPVSGLAALRRRALRQPAQPLQFPVVFTSEMPGVVLPAEGSWSVTVAQSKTPGVHLDNISAERDGSLHCAWDYVPAMYPAPLIEAMFQAYLQMLESVADDAAAWRESSPAAAPSARRQQFDSH
ncbi:SDR family NAD(P)-dependent oxidoreductase [Janthinobacterium fluminis]|uniref:SDR family oxidoreductase n=1 Tax=Janthinobacterium fluminis TaxID=2987524 RepID=A0ABT5K0C0_9BURK|nr:SDR family NAD(P)-dependent oxidoreductase [Janthinobacterium fluminis]MDC8758422.1 SDR family oxidoreductase [Janthinobacterium fluminis]